MPKDRVTVSLRLGYEPTPADTESEWAHEEDYREHDDGVELRWDGPTRVFVPWSSVLRVDYEPCYCSECREGEK